VYISVVSRLSWPSSTWIVRRSIPRSTSSCSRGGGSVCCSRTTTRPRGGRSIANESGRRTRNAPAPRRRGVARGLVWEARGRQPVSPDKMGVGPATSRTSSSARRSRSPPSP
jgi:hypothetical protein